MKHNEARKHPKVGVGVIVVRDGKVLTHRRLGSIGAGLWGLVGGHLEWGETWEECAVREVQEEAGLAITNIRFVTAMNDIYPEDDKHYVTIFVQADWAGGEIDHREPEFGDSWMWTEWEAIPEPRFFPLAKLHQSDFHPLRKRSADFGTSSDGGDELIEETPPRWRRNCVSP